MPNKLTRFWKELKRRNVVRVTTVYAGAAFVIIELINNITEPLRLPGWTPALIIVLLAIGFPLAIIFSWIYDVHPEGGIKKTEPAGKVKGGDIPKSSNNWKIASYISFAVIAGLIMLNIFGGNRKARIDESLAKSIAVLPFYNHSLDPEQDVMCLGLTDEVINQLFKIESFDKVSSFTTVLNYRSPDRNIPEIAQELEVNYILEGTYKKIGDQLRVSAQLIECKTDRHIWQQNYNRPYEEIISLQSEIALQIAGQLKAFISGDEEERIQKVPTNNLLAYEYYRQGVAVFDYALNYDSAIHYFQEAIRMDSSFALAYTYLAQSYQYISRYSLSSVESYQDAHKKATEAVMKAYELDPQLGDVLAVYGLILAENWDLDAPEELFRRALEMSPNSPEVYSSFAQYLRWMGRYEECIAYAKKALELDPSSYFRYQWLAVYYIYAGQYDKSVEQLELVNEMFPDNDYYLFSYGVNLIMTGNFDLVSEYVDRIEFPDPIYDLVLISHVAWVYAKAGYTDKAQILLDKMLEYSKTWFLDPVYPAIVFAGLGDFEKTFFYLDRGYELHSGQMVYLRGYADLFFKDISNDPRYIELLRKMGFKDQ